VRKEGSKVTDNNLGTWMLEEAKGKLWHYVMPIKHNKVFFSIRFYVCSRFQTKMWGNSSWVFWDGSLMLFFSFWGHNRRNSLLRKRNRKGRCLLIFFT
jgi:hypothetical protein